MQLQQFMHSKQASCQAQANIPGQSCKCPDREQRAAASPRCSACMVALSVQGSLSSTGSRFYQPRPGLLFHFVNFISSTSTVVTSESAHLTTQPHPLNLRRALLMPPNISVAYLNRAHVTNPGLANFSATASSTPPHVSVGGFKSTEPVFLANRLTGNRPRNHPASYSICRGSICGDSICGV